MTELAPKTNSPAPAFWAKSMSVEANCILRWTFAYEVSADWPVPLGLAQELIWFVGDLRLQIASSLETGVGWGRKKHHQGTSPYV